MTKAFCIFARLASASDDLEFTLVYDLKVGILQSDFSFFYMARIKTFPKSNQTLDEEKDVKEKFADEYYESELAGLEYRFVVSKEKENYAIQISDVVAAFFKHYYAFIEASDISEVRSFREGLTPMQRGNLNLFSQLIDKSTDECKLFLHRVIVPQDEVKAAILFQF